MIRLAALDDVEYIPMIESQAGELFRKIGMDSIADAPVPSLELVTRYVEERRLWVYDDGAGPVAFVVASVVDDCAHIVQVSVVPERRGESLGAALIDEVESWARSHGLCALTLTTFRDVPWNEPYYQRIGFSEVRPPPGSELADLVCEEARELDAAARVTMRREISMA